MKKTYLGRPTKTGSMRTEVTLRHKPPCLCADPLECNQQVRSVISSVIIFRSSIHGRWPDNRTVDRPHSAFPLHAFSDLVFILWAFTSACARCYLRHVMDFFFSHMSKSACTVCGQKSSRDEEVTHARVKLERNFSGSLFCVPELPVKFGKGSKLKHF